MGLQKMTMKNAIQNIYDFLCNKGNLICSIDEAISAQIFCEEAKIKSLKQAKNNELRTT